MDSFINIIYICSFFITYFILFIIMEDLKKMKSKLYNEINYKIWFKLYAFISISMIHLIWSFSILFLDYKDNNTLIYGFTPFLFIPYIIYIITDLKDNSNDSIASYKINKYLNNLISLYFIFIIIWIIMPNNIKENFVSCFKNIIKDIFKLI